MSHSNALRIARADPIPSDPPRFLVAGQAGSASGDVKLYEWHKSRREMRMVGLQTDIGQIKALAWSPSPAHRKLIAVGLNTGRTLLLNLSPNTLSAPISGFTSTVGALPVKHVRPITTVAFSHVDPNYIATGYERHRSDYSLLIWDVSTAISSVPPDGNAAWHRPLDRLEVTNLSSSTTRATPGEHRHIQQYCPSEHVNDVAFMPAGYSLLASTNNKAIRLYDLRQASKDTTSSGAMQWNTRAVLGLTPDQTHEGRFASFETSPGGTVSTVRLWDTRKPGIDTARVEIRSGVTGLEWAGGGSGYAKLAVGSRDGVSIWDVTDGREVDEEVDEWTLIGDVKNVIRPKQALHSFAFGSGGSRSDIFFVVKDGTIGIGPVAPTPIIAWSGRADFAISGHALRVVDPDAANDEEAESEPEEGDQSDNEDEAIRSNRFQLNSSRINDILAEAERSRSGSPAGSVYGMKLKRETAVRMSDDVTGMDLGVAGLRRVLQADVGCVMRCRAEEGYGMSNMLLNAAIATRYPGHDRLAGIWEFIDHLLKVMDPETSVTRSANLTHAAIISVWMGSDIASPSSPAASVYSQLMPDSGRPSSRSSGQREPVRQGSAAWTSLRNNQLPSRTPLNGSPKTPDPSKAPVIGDSDLAAAVEHINARREEEHPGRVGRTRLPQTEKVAQRRMILAICGERDEQKNLIEDDMRTKAASWAYFSGEEEQAVRILMNSSNSKHRLCGTTLAGFLSQARSTRASSFFDEHWRSLINRVDDPYIRAVLSRVGGDDWESVLEEEAIPLIDRIAIAVCNLSDDELEKFLLNRLGRFTRNPSPSLTSLALVGFTSPAIQIMQKWLERTGDIQTVALLASYFPASRLLPAETDAMKRWTEGYRELLDSWGMWGERVEFDVGRMEVGRRLGENRVEPGNCPVCNNVLSVAHEEHLQVKSGLSREKASPNERTGSCTLCGQTLPRCVICLKLVDARFSHHTHDEYDEGLALSPSDTVDNAYVCCMTCRHGGHANHILAWFNGDIDGGGHDICPVAACDCECANI